MSAAQKRAVIKRRRLTGFIMIGAAAVLLSFSGWLTYSYVHTSLALQTAKAAALQHRVTVPAQKVVAKPDTISGTPVKIDIPSVGISQPVDLGQYNADTGDWTLSYHAVYWAGMTAPINSDSGNTFIYGHDVKEIFGNLLNAQVGAKAIITTDNGYVFTYTLKSSTAVSPTDVSLIQQTSSPTLTVQTCSGSWYQYRQMFTFSLDGYVKAS